MMKLISYFLLMLFFGIFKSNAQKDTIAIRNVHIIPIDKDTILKNHDVLIAHKKIIAINPTSTKSLKQTYTTINGTNKYLLPGFSEMHFHNQNDIKNEFKLLIANGITTARNMAEDQNQDQIENKKLANELTIAPKYFTAGPYLMRNNLKTIEEVIKVVQKHKNRGYDYLKLADNLPKNIYLKLLEETSKHNISVIGHGQRKLPLEYSLRMKSIAHIEEFMNIFTAEEKKDTAFLIKSAKQIKSSGIYVSPTLGIFDMIMKYADDKKHEKLTAAPILKYLPKHYANFWKSDSVNYRKHSWFTAKKSLIRLQNELNWQKSFTKILHQEKVFLLSSSDTYGLFLPGFSLHKELELINASGVSTYETLKTTTIHPARYLNTISQEGTVSVGKSANLVLLNKNPLDDIRNTQSIFGVFVKGKWLNTKAIEQLLKEVENSNAK